MRTNEYDYSPEARAKAARKAARETMAIAAAMLAAIVVVFCLIVWFGQTHACASRWDGTYETKFGWTAGCRVNVNGKWFPEASVRAFQ